MNDSHLVNIMHYTINNHMTFSLFDAQSSSDWDITIYQTTHPRFWDILNVNYKLSAE